ncbi:MAG: helicase-related protein [Candidatus Heimdallarchaeota archaeon]
MEIGKKTSELLSNLHLFNFLSELIHSKVSNRKSVIQERSYQSQILLRLWENYNHDPKRHTIAEVDTGLGKRVLTYLLLKETLPSQRALLLLHSTTSFSETIHYFIEEYGGFAEDEFHYISSRTPGWLRKKIIMNRKSRIIAATPQTFANAFEKIPDKEKPSFEIIIINEIDKIVRRQGDSRLLIFPYNSLLPHFISNGSWILGMTGTIRDTHVLYDPVKEQLEIHHEAITLDKRIPDLYILRMETILEETDMEEYIQYTDIEMYPIQPDSNLKDILNLINDAIKGLREDAIEETLEERPGLLDSIPERQFARVASMLEARDSKKLMGLLLTRKYCTAMQPAKYRKFLFRLKQFGITKSQIEALPRMSQKVLSVLELIKKRPKNSKTVILCSYLDTAHLLQEEIGRIGITPFLVTGETPRKEAVLNEFKGDSSNAVLVMTSVGERDIDLPQADLLIVYDVVNTVKTMYQRMKRTRGGRVLCLYYQDTFEERKVARLLNEINQRYPWSSKIDLQSRQ